MRCSLSNPSDTSVVWFRLGDIRTRNHAGLAGGSDYSKVAALLTVDELEASDPDYIDLFARTLRARGSRLFIRAGTDHVRLVADFAEEINADAIFVKADPTEETESSIQRLNESLQGEVSVNKWREQLRTWDDDVLGDVPSEYPAFLKWKKRNAAQVVDVQEEPALFSTSPAEVVATVNVSELSARVRQAQPQYEAFQQQYREDCELAGLLTPSIEGDDIDVVADGLVKSYLEASDAYEQVDLVRTLDPVFRLGLLSPACIYSIVRQHERENGRIWRFVYREGAKRLLDYLDAREFAQLRAQGIREAGATIDGVHKARFWSWRGYLIRYVQEDNAPPDAPPLVLVHGFGASSQHFSRSIALLKKRFRVYALDVVGYGQSEKPPTKYTQDFWEYMIWDFVRDVVKEPVYMAGNSIGGYFSASFAADAYPELCAGLVLLNSAGRIDDPDDPVSVPGNEIKRTINPIKAITPFLGYLLRESRFVRMIAANVLIRNLRGRIGKTLKFVYPQNPDRADEQLAHEIYRNSLDFGADEVLASGFVLPPQRALSELLQKFKGPMLVFQGLRDPLNASSDRIKKIQNVYPSATIVTTQAGHCPHDEDAEAFVESVSAWMESENLKRAGSTTTRSVVPQEHEASVPAS